MSNLSRRSLVTSAAALPALAVPAVAIAATQSDAVLRDLWSEYLVVATACDAAARRYATAHAAYEAEVPPCPDDVLPGDHWRAYKWLRQKHGADQLYDAVSEAFDRTRNVVERIRRTEATTLFDIGVKLAALPPGISVYEGRSSDGDDYIDAVASVLSDINRLLGTDFVGMEEAQS